MESKQPQSRRKDRPPRHQAACEHGHSPRNIRGDISGNAGRRLRQGANRQTYNSGPQQIEHLAQPLPDNRRRVAAPELVQNDTMSLKQNGSPS
jgi:hypothetical protein